MSVENLRQRVRTFAKEHKDSLMYGGAILTTTVVAGFVGFLLRPPSAAEALRVAVRPESTTEIGNREFDITYNCMLNTFPDSQGENHIEVIVTSATYMTSDDPTDVLSIKWDIDNGDTYKQYDPAAASKAQVPPRLFRGRAKGTFELARGYADYTKKPMGSFAEVVVTRGRSANPQSSQVVDIVTRQVARVPRYCN